MKSIAPKFNLSLTIFDNSSVPRIDGDDLFKKVGFTKKQHSGENFWIYSTKEIKTYDFEEAFELLLRELKGDLEQIIQTIKSGILESKIDICIQIKGDETPSLFCTREHLNVLQELNAEMDIDLYVE